MAIETMPHDIADSITSAEDLKHFLTFAFEDGEPDYIVQVLAIAARSRGMAEIAGKLGLSHAEIQAAMLRDDHLSLAMLMTVLNALGLKLSIKSKLGRTEQASSKPRRRA